MEVSKRFAALVILEVASKAHSTGHAFMIIYDLSSTVIVMLMCQRFQFQRLFHEMIILKV